MKKRELLCCWVAMRFQVLVPKRRGMGFQMVPYGHHFHDGLSQVEAVAGCDIVGLDGALEFCCPEALYHGKEEEKATFEAKVLPALQELYGCPARRVSPKEFWSNHPQAVRKSHGQ